MSITRKAAHTFLSVLVVVAFLVLTVVTPKQIDAASGNWDNTSNNIWYEDGNVVIGSDQTPNGLFEVWEEGTGRTTGMLIVDPDGDGEGGSGDGAVILGQLSSTGGDTFEQLVLRNRIGGKVFGLSVEDNELLLLGTNNSTPKLHFREDSTGKDWVFVNEGDKLVIADETTASGSDRILGIENDGDVRISRTLYAEEIKVESSVVPDYVFSDGYELMSLEEVGEFISQNNHLPGVTPATTGGLETVAIGERSQQLLEKLEELYLYTLQQQEEIDYLKSLLEK